MSKIRFTHHGEPSEDVLHENGDFDGFLKVTKGYAVDSQS